ncbi:PAS domain S-box protein [Paraburkholderia sp. BR10882]|uniref:hybrid sensor histidine kinase/response regulator n=1 Tax=unclassified Paraburkholderia TaxID=2615204 RepID=UPI0034CD0DF3
MAESHKLTVVWETTDWAARWIDSTSDYAIFALTTDGRVASWNPGGESVYGYAPEEILGRPLSIFYTDEDRRDGVPEDVLRETRETGRSEAEGWRSRKDGSLFWASVILTALHDPAGQLLGYGKIVRDMSDKKRAHDAVVESERRFRMLVDGVTDYSIFMLSPDGRVTNWNQGARRIKGYAAPEIIGSHFSRFYTPEDAAAGLPQRGLETAAREGRFESEGWRVRKDGSRFWAHVVIDAIRDNDGALAGFAKITRDVTEQRETERALDETRMALYQSQKMEAIGKLTGGVAHDFNNVLQVVRGNLELIESRLSRDSQIQERLDKAIDAVERGAKLASQLLAFGRRQPLQPVVINLATALRNMDDMLRRALDETIQVETVVAGGLWNTYADVHQLENVILNLAINARDAMPDGGRLTLELGNTMLDDRYVAGLQDVPAGQYVLLAVTDTGVGMSPDILARAIDPFFTTKPEGYGTGLGLSMVYGFVKQSGGHLRLYSEVGQGTTVKVYLPRSMGSAIERPSPVSTPLRGGRETVLVVEDDAKLQSTVVDMLGGLGYTVLKADDPQQALAIIRSGVHIDLLFTDVVMPGPLKSPDMARQACETLPQLKVLFTSGYTQNAIVHGGRLDEGVELLSKPYSRDQLARKIRRLLGSPGIDLEVVEEGEREQGLAPGSLRVLVVDDDAGSADAVGALLEMLGHCPQLHKSAESADEALRKQEFDVLLTDISLPGMSGVDFALKAVRERPHIRVIFGSGSSVPPTGQLPFSWRELRKPYTADDLRGALS